MVATSPSTTGTPTSKNPLLMSDCTARSSTSSSSAGGVVPLKSSAQYTRQVGGRSFNLINQNHVMAVDDEEHHLQDLQHQAATLVMDSLYAAPELVRRALAPRQDVVPAILDIGTGSGAWAVDMAREFPHANVVGTDLVPPSLDPKSTPINCRFEIDDMNLDMSHFAKCLNVVHIRFACLGMTSFKDTIYRVAQTLRADGVILLVSGDTRFYREDLSPLPDVKEGEPGWTAIQALLTARKVVARKRSRDVDGKNLWTKWLKDSPMYTNVGVQDIYVPVGAWNPSLDARCTHIAQIVQKCIKSYFPKAPLVHGGYPEATIDRWLNLAEREIKEMRPPILLKWRYAWATRTRERWTPDFPVI